MCFCLIILVYIVFSVICNATGIIQCEKNNTPIYVNGVKQKYSDDLYNIDGKIYIPLRESYEKDGYNVSWENNSINIESIQYPLLKEPNEIENGTLENGMKYIVYGDRTFTLDNLEKTYKDYTQNRTYARLIDGKTAIDVGYVYLKTTIEEFKKTYGDNMKMFSIYNKDMNAWLVSFSADNGYASDHQQSCVIILDANNGTILKVYALY